MDIRIAVAADREAVVALWEAAGLTRPWNDPVADFDRSIAGPASAVLVALEDGIAVGTAMVGDDGHRGWIYYLAVRPDLRGRGHGRALVSACEAWLRGRGCPKVQLMVRGSNDGVVGFYEAIGYEPVDVRVVGRHLD